MRHRQLKLLMHFKNGREAKNGDKVVMIPGYGSPVAGILYDAQPGNDNCNGRLAIPAPTDPSVNLKECLHADDIAAATIQDSTMSVPPGTAPTPA